MAFPHMAGESNVVTMNPGLILNVVAAAIDASLALLIVMLYPRVTSVKPKLGVRKDAIEF
jgi:hypothetical protein